MSEQLKRQAEEIRDEVQKGANTAERVGGVLVGIVEEVANAEDLYVPKSFYEGSNAVTSLAGLVISKQSITALLSEATDISLTGELKVGQELYIRCVATAEFVQPIPTSGAWTSMSGDSVYALEGSVFEISIWCYTSRNYSISIKVKEW